MLLRQATAAPAGTIADPVINLVLKPANGAFAELDAFGELFSLFEPVDG